MSENSLVTLAVIALVVSAVAAGYAYMNSNGYRQQVTGFASTDTATVNLTVESSADINFTTDNINFQSGRVNSGATNATLYTNGTVVGGNWTANTAGLILENIGNTNVSIDLASAQGSASAFLGGTNPQYLWNISNNKTGSCDVPYGGYTLSTLVNANSSMRVCQQLLFNNSKDTLRIDVELVIPSDSKTGALSDTITATATPV